MWESDKNFFFTKSNKYLVEYRGSKIEIIPAPEPTDVFWENLHVSNRTKFFRRLLGYLITIFVLLAASISIYVLTRFQSI